MGSTNQINPVALQCPQCGASLPVSDQASGEHSLRISGTANDSQAEVASQLYQLSLTEPVRNQFIGDHGFTGLSYVYHPISRAEVQYTCKAQ